MDGSDETDCGKSLCDMYLTFTKRYADGNFNVCVIYTVR